MFAILKSFKNRLYPKEIVPEVLFALKGRFPERVEVMVHDSEDGGYWAEVKDLPGCITQADNGTELFQMLNDAIYTYLDVPEEYVPFVSTYFPSEEVRKNLNIKIPESFLKKDLVFQRS